jgi:hypothetical protein
VPSVGDARGVRWLALEAALDALRVALEAVELCALTAKDGAEGRASRQRTAGQVVDGVLGIKLLRLNAQPAERRRPPVAFRFVGGRERGIARYG